MGPATVPLRVAGMYVYVPESGIATRDGLNVYDLRARWHPVRGRAAGVAARRVRVGAQERRRRASGWYAALNYNAQDVAWKPLVTLRYAWFSGDKPGHVRSGKASTRCTSAAAIRDWYQGKLASTLFNNTNLASVARRSRVTPDERNILQLIALAFRAVRDELAARGSRREPAGRRPAAASRQGARERGRTSSGRTLFDKHVNVNVFAAYACARRGVQGPVREPGRQRAGAGAESGRSSMSTTEDDRTKAGALPPRALPHDVAAAVRALLPLPLVPARDGLGLRAERDDRGRPRRAPARATSTSSTRRRRAARARRSRAARSAASRCGATTRAAATLVRFVRVGTLDEPDRLPPDVHIFTMSKQPWVILAGGAPAFEEFYDIAALWPAGEPRAARRRIARSSASRSAWSRRRATMTSDASCAMIGVLIIAHDTLPDSLVKAVTHVLGTTPPQLETLSVAGHRRSVRPASRRARASSTGSTPATAC